MFFSQNSNIFKILKNVVVIGVVDGVVGVDDDVMDVVVVVVVVDRSTQNE